MFKLIVLGRDLWVIFSVTVICAGQQAFELS